MLDDRPNYLTFGSQICSSTSMITYVFLFGRHVWFSSFMPITFEIVPPFVFIQYNAIWPLAQLTPLYYIPLYNAFIFGMQLKDHNSYDNFDNNQISVFPDICNLENMEFLYFWNSSFTNFSESQISQVSSSCRILVIRNILLQNVTIFVCTHN